MSLINDALKRARQAQPKQSAPPAPGVSLRPVEAARRKNFGLGRFVGIILAVLAVVAVGFWWNARRRDVKPVPVPVTQKESTDASVAQAPAPKPPPASTRPASKPVETLQAAPPVSTRVVSSTSPTQPASNAPSVAKPSAPTQAPAAEPAAAPPAIAWPKLQGILYRSDQPSALLNNKTVLIGGRSGEFLVVAIDRQSVTLACAGQTNVLRLTQ